MLQGSQHIAAKPFALDMYYVQCSQYDIDGQLPGNGPKICVVCIDLAAQKQWLQASCWGQIRLLSSIKEEWPGGSGAAG